MPVSHVNRKTNTTRRCSSETAVLTDSVRFGKTIQKKKQTVPKSSMMAYEQKTMKITHVYFKENYSMSSRNDG